MLALTHGASSLVIAPENGAGLIGWMVEGTPILRRALPEAAIGGNPHALGCFPLLPYCNRVGGRRFVWDGTEYRLRGNFGDHPHTIHGIGWQRAWHVAKATAWSTTLVLEHRPDDDWPFAFRATVTYALSAAGLSVTLSLTNTHAEPAPAGIGLHPYFVRAHDPRLSFRATGAWRNGTDGLPSRHGCPPADWDHSEPCPVLRSRLDNCFTGWDGAARIEWAAAGLRLETDGAFPNLQVFTPSWADFFCAEPVSHVPDAINRSGLADGQGMTRLAPAQTLSGTVRMVLTGD